MSPLPCGKMACLVQKLLSHKTCPPASPASLTSWSLHTDQLLLWDSNFWRTDNSLLKLIVSSIKCLPAAKARLPEMRCVLVIAVFRVSCCHRSCSFRTLRVLPVIPPTHSWGAQRCWTVAHSLSVRLWQAVLWPCISTIKLLIIH